MIKKFIFRHMPSLFLCGRKAQAMCIRIVCERGPHKPFCQPGAYLRKRASEIIKLCKSAQSSDLARHHDRTCHRDRGNKHRRRRRSHYRRHPSHHDRAQQHAYHPHRHRQCPIAYSIHACLCLRKL